MNYEKFGIVITILVLCCVFGFVAISQSNIIDIPEVAPVNNTLAEYCAKLNIEC